MIEIATLILTILGIWTIMMMGGLAIVITLDIWEHFYTRFKRR